jgi:hypothetical protein
MGQGHLDPRKGTLPPTNLIFARRGERNLISVEFSPPMKQLQTDTHTIPRIRRNYHESIPQKDFFFFPRFFTARLLRNVRSKVKEIYQSPSVRYLIKK